MDDLGVPRTPISGTPYLIGSPGYAFPSGVRRTELRCFGEFCSATTQHAQSSQGIVTLVNSHKEASDYEDPGETA